jgi:predicted TIM-barrel fold metal-dependent hydrolase
MLLPLKSFINNGFKEPPGWHLFCTHWIGLQHVGRSNLQCQAEIKDMKTRYIRNKEVNMLRKGIGNGHIHLYNFECIPDMISLLDLGKQKFCFKFLVDITEDKVRGKLGDLAVNSQQKKLRDILNCSTVMDVGEKYWEMMDRENGNEHIEKIDYSIVILNDYCPGAIKIRGEKELWLSYKKLLEKTAAACALYPFKYFFVYGFDPRVENAGELLEDAYNNGIVGIKLYPALGFHPVPQKNMEMKIKTIKRTKSLNYEYNLLDEEVVEEEDPLGEFDRFEMLSDIRERKYTWEFEQTLTEKECEMVKRNLEHMYDFAASKNLPLIVHSGPGGSRLCTVNTFNNKPDQMAYLREFAQPSNYKEIAKEYELRICFAHFGGKTELAADKPYAPDWREEMKNMIREADGWDSRGRFYADHSYELCTSAQNVENQDLEAYIKRRVEETAGLLKDDTINKYLFFGTDWPFSSGTMGELKYKSYYDKDLSPTQNEKYFKDNIAEFLFGPERKIPDNYIEFLKKIHKAKAMDVSMTPWVKEMEDNKFRLVTDEDLHFHN